MYFLGKVYYKIKSVIVEFICSILPIKRNKIIFNNFGGRGFGDNLRYIAEEILREKLPYDLVWIVNSDEEDFPAGIRTVRKGSGREKIELSTAKVYINNIKSAINYKKKKGAFYIQTWHADFAPKLVEGEAEEYLDKSYLEVSKKDSLKTDVILSGSEMFSKIARNKFFYPISTKVFECGVPRNDAFFKSVDTIPYLKEKYVGSSEVKVAVYAPTFRDDGRMDVYSIDVNAVLEALENKTKEQWVMIIRLHPHLANRTDMFIFNEKIINGSKFPDPQELFFLSDLLISDYSSVISDFLIMRKPVFLYVSDMECYLSNCRGLRPEYFKLPFPFCKNSMELVRAIREYDDKKMRDEEEKYLHTVYVSFDDGHASKRVVTLIKQMLNEKYRND